MCPDYNMERCPKQANGPHRLKHLCNYVLSDGSICLQWQHTAVRCPHNINRKVGKTAEKCKAGQ